MTVSAGIGIASFNFDDARGFWKWVDICEAGGIDSIWQSDRLDLAGGQPRVHECDGRTGRRDPADQVRHERGELGRARSGPHGQAVRDYRRPLGRASLAGVRTWQQPVPRLRRHRYAYRATGQTHGRVSRDPLPAVVRGDRVHRRRVLQARCRKHCAAARAAAAAAVGGPVRRRKRSSGPRAGARVGRPASSPRTRSRP